MLTYICCLFSPSVTCSRFGFIWKALKPILYVRGSAWAIESRLKQRRASRKGYSKRKAMGFCCAESKGKGGPGQKKGGKVTDEQRQEEVEQGQENCQCDGSRIKWRE